MITCKARGVVLVPLDRSELWWPLVARGSKGAVVVDGVERRCAFRRRRGLLWSDGRPCRAGYRDLLAVQLDFAVSGGRAPAEPEWRPCAMDDKELLWR